MSRLNAILVVALIALMPLSAQASEFSSAQKAEIESIVRELLTKKEPEIIVKAAQTVQEKMDKEALAKGSEAVLKNKDRIYNDPTSPVGGNPKGDVTLVQFFDYSCGYCKMVQKHLEKVMEGDSNLRLIYKEFPILGDASVLMSKAALASNKQGKYVEMHTALMKAKRRMHMKDIMDLAEDLGLDTKKLQKDMESDEIKKTIEANRGLAEELGIRGTPSFVLGNKLYPGALPYEQMKEAIATARKGK